MIVTEMIVRMKGGHCGHGGEQEESEGEYVHVECNGGSKRGWFLADTKE